MDSSRGQAKWEGGRGGRSRGLCGQHRPLQHAWDSAFGLTGPILQEDSASAQPAAPRPALAFVFIWPARCASSGLTLRVIILLQTLGTSSRSISTSVSIVKDAAICVQAAASQPEGPLCYPRGAGRTAPGEADMGVSPSPRGTSALGQAETHPKGI